MPLKVKHKKVSLSPDSGDGSMIQPSDWNAEHEIDNVELINSDVTYNLKADGSGSFTTLYECIAYLNRCVIANDPKVSINLGEGIFNETSTILYTNKSLDKISIVGADPYDYTYTNVSVSGSAGAWVNVISIASVDTSKVKVGQYVMIYSTTTAGTNPARLWGCHLITAVSSTSITVMNRNNHAAGPSGQAGKLKVFPTIIRSAGNQTLFKIISSIAGRANGSTPSIPFLHHVVLEGSRLISPWSCGIQIIDQSLVNLRDSTGKTYPKIGVVGFVDGIQVNKMSTLLAEDLSLCISDSGNVGICAYEGSYITAHNGIIVSGVRTNTAGYALNTDSRGFIQIGGPTAGNGAILTGNKTNINSYAQSHTRSYNIVYDDAVTTSAQPAVNTLGQVNSYNER